MKRGRGPWGAAACTRWSHWLHSFSLGMAGQVVLHIHLEAVRKEQVDRGMRKLVLGRWLAVRGSHLVVAGQGSHMAGAVHTQPAEADQDNQLTGAVRGTQLAVVAQDTQMSLAALGHQEED